MWNERYVGRRHRIVGEPRRPHPSQCLPFPCHDVSGPSSADEQWHQQMKIFVRVTREDQRSEAGSVNVNSKFLLQFTDQRRFRRFAGLHLAAGKLPKACHRPARGPPCDKHAPIDVDKRDGRNEEKALGGTQLAITSRVRGETRCNGVHGRDQRSRLSQSDRLSSDSRR
jgi:hypothetical protein